jgi:hypothetical protein
MNLQSVRVACQVRLLQSRGGNPYKLAVRDLQDRHRLKLVHVTPDRTEIIHRSIDTLNPQAELTFEPTLVQLNVTDRAITLVMIFYPRSHDQQS